MNKSYYAIIPANVRYDQDLTPNAKLLYGEITALCNERGYCWATNQYFAELYSASNRTITRWISQLVEKGYIVSEVTYKQGSKEVDSRKIRIGTPNDKNDDTPRQKCHEGIDKNVTTPLDKNVQDNNTVINTTFNNTKDINISSFNNDVETDFNEFWSLYPKKADKKKSFEKFKKLRKKYSLEIILNGTQSYLDYCKRENQYFKNPLTFLNGECFNDEYEFTNKPVKTERNFEEEIDPEVGF